MNQELTLMDVVSIRATLTNQLVQAIAHHKAAELENLPHTRKVAASAIADIKRQLQDVDDMRGFYEKTIIESVKTFMSNAREGSSHA